VKNSNKQKSKKSKKSKRGGERSFS
jgi:hypothetical protein